MSKLNKIFYGPAGTGKTRASIEDAVKIINKSKESHNLDFISDINNFEDILNIFKTASNPLSLNIPATYIKRIQNETNTEKILKDIPRKYEISLDEIKTYKENYNKYPLIETVTFHPSYGYQDFVEGISVETTEKNQLIYTAKDGIFKKICDRAINNPEYNYVLIIDEINRGDISSIFGELFTLIEDSKRKGKKEELNINLPYSKDEKGNPKKLIVPSNLFISATMNTVDKSIALIDVALRRRFNFIECMPNYELAELNTYQDIDISKLLKVINERITILKNEHYQIGHSYFFGLKTFDDLKRVIIKSIIPLLQEYFYDDWQSICAVLNQSFSNPKKNHGLLILNQSNQQIFKEEFKELIEYRNKIIFKINNNFEKEDIFSIYE